MHNFKAKLWPCPHVDTVSIRSAKCPKLCVAPPGLDGLMLAYPGLTAWATLASASCRAFRRWGVVEPRYAWSENKIVLTHSQSLQLCIRA